jgi:serine O-acetyltransferase
MYGRLDLGLRYMFWFRLSNCNNVLLGVAARLIHYSMSQRYHIDIPRTAKIGYGFLLLHGGPVVINSSAVIGNNVNFGHFSTVGSLLLHGAHIGDEVYIGPSVCIVEGVTIGKGATIGAGAVVVNDVPEGSTVAGVPAKVISYKEAGRFIWRKWNLDWNKK